MTEPAARPSAAESVANVPLIPREHLFGNPQRSGGSVSPDGQWLSWMAPHDGVMNVWLAPAADPASARVVTHSTDRPIPTHFWAADSASVLYIQDKAGDENYLLYQIDVATGEERNLTPRDNTRVRLMGGSNTLKDQVLVGLNDRDARFHDVYRLDLASGALELVMQNDSYAGFLADDALTLRWAVRQNAAGGTDMFEIDDGKVADTPRESTTIDDALTTSAAGYTTDGRTLYWIDSRGRDTAVLIAEDVASGTRTVMAEDPRADISGTLRHPITGVVEAYSATYLKSEWTALDAGVGASLEWLRSQLPGEFGIGGRTDADDKWVVSHDPVTGPAVAYRFDRTAQTLTEFYVTRPELVGAPLQPMDAVEIPTRDGLTMVGYLTLPAGEGPAPMVLLVHGGPWARDHYGFNRTHQWLANRGYAVLSVNFRGSTGFGKAFVNAANLEWGAAMHDDLIDAVEWAIARGTTSRDKVAIMGGSYGGYATLAGLAFTPEVFACGVDIVGPSNLETLLETIPPYWEPMIKQFHERMGNPGTPEGKALLVERSPLHAADKICRPLLIGQGANDPRVKQSESDQIVAALQNHGIPVTYVVFPDEGHGFAKPTNSIAFHAVTENFLAAVLGGRAEPVGGTVTASTARIEAGADLVGLA